MINLMQGDCLERMKEIPDGSVDMILCDPPYEMVHQKSLKRLKSGMLRQDGRPYQEQLKSGNIVTGFDINSFLSSCVRLFKEKQKFNLVTFCSKQQLGKFIAWAETNKFQYGIGVWHKTNPAPLCNCKYLNDVEFWIYIKGSKSKIRGTYDSKSLVYTSPVNKNDKALYKHPTIKPLDLIEKFLINHTLVDYVVVDPFMGTGSTGVAAVNLNRNFIGIELDQGYFDIATSRINAALEA